jgi:hypothetical protein
MLVDPAILITVTHQEAVAELKWLLSMRLIADEYV